ncbi:MAG: hypothetical protein ACYC8T_20390 [Myxococcaceae bacterium]
MSWRALALGAAIGFVVAFFPSCGQKQPARCLRSNCSGCCDDKLGCQAGTTPAACGVGALTCQVCGANQSCVDGACRSGSGGGGGGSDGGTDGGGGDCSPSTCASGCCQTGQCKPGNQFTACGTGGTTCIQCLSGYSCQQNQCSNAVCATCSDALGTCQPGNTAQFCGNDGGSCVNCPIPQTCQNGTCVGGACSAATCASGCCDPGTNTCVEVASMNDAQCGTGTGGDNCLACQGQELCTAGVCYFDGGSGGGGGGAGGGAGGGGTMSLCGPGGIDPCTTGCCSELIPGSGFFMCTDPPDDLSCGIGGAVCTNCFLQMKTCNVTTGACQ